jgi:hypothetical protein
VFIGEVHPSVDHSTGREVGKMGPMVVAVTVAAVRAMADLHQEVRLEGEDHTCQGEMDGWVGVET